MLKQIKEEGYSVLEVSKATGVSDVTLYTWLGKAGWKYGESQYKKKLTETERENRELRAEIRKLEMERDILKKAAAYESERVPIKYVFIGDNRTEFTVLPMCRILKVNPSGFTDG